MRAWADRFDLLVAESDWPRPSPALKQVFRDALMPDPDLGDLVVFLDALFGAWRFFLFLSGVLMVGLAFTLNEIAGNTGNVWGITIGVFPMGFCLVGELVTAFRLKGARRSRRLAGFENIVSEASRPMLTGRVNDVGFVLQVFGAFLASLVVGLIIR